MNTEKRPQKRPHGTLTEMDMKFYGGLIGVRYENGVLRPAVGWSVIESLVDDIESKNEGF